MLLKKDSKSARARARRWIQTLALGAGALMCSVHANATAKMTFDEEFDSLSLWDGTSGTWATDFWYDQLNGNGNTLENNGEQEWYINSNCPLTLGVKPWKVANGILTITGKHANKSVQPLINNYKYTSGELNSYHSFSQLYGYFKMRAKLPTAQGTSQGMWPAFWMLPEDGSWPPEIDIMEALGNDPTHYYASLHWGTADNEQSAGPKIEVPDTSADFHTYAVDWEADYITFYFDGTQVWRHKTPAEMRKPMYIEVNLAMGGYWPGNVDKTTVLPGHMQVDWIHAYTSKP